jgi:hypothetical protein
MRTDAEYRRHIRTMTENDDAKALCRRELPPDAFKTMNGLRNHASRSATRFRSSLETFSLAFLVCAPVRNWGWEAR